MKCFRLVLFTCFAACMCSWAETGVVSAYGTSISVPPGWMFVNIGQKPIVYQVLSPLEENDIFQENITVSVDSTRDAKTAREYRNLNFEEVKNNLAQFHIIQEVNESTLSFWYEFQYDFEGMQCQAKQVIILKGSKAYTMTLTALVTSYSKNMFAYNQITRTFRILAK